MVKQCQYYILQYQSVMVTNFQQALVQLCSYNKPLLNLNNQYNDMDPNSAFSKKPSHPVRPLTSYHETAHRKYLNFDLTQIKNSLNLLEQSTKLPSAENLKHSDTYQDFRKPAQQVETIKKSTPRTHYVDCKENTDSTNFKERISETVQQKDGKFKPVMLKPMNTVPQPHRPQQQILTSMLSSDGKQHIISKCLTGQDLRKATQDQITQGAAEKRRIYPLLVDPGAKLLNYEQTKVATKKVGIVSSYSANTNIGISRNYNQDRVSIILNISKQSTKCSIFAIYDGHGGITCCDYLRDNLHENIISNSHFPSNPKQAIINGVRETEYQLITKLDEQMSKTGKMDKSGSCGIMVFVIGNQCFVANIGDSRAVLSAEGGRFSYNLSRDHKPIDPLEQKRILEAGGKIYRTEMVPVNSKPGQTPVFGPLRVFPGKLSVSRTFGDIEAKHEKMAGNHKVVVAEPEIKQFSIKQTHDFIVLGCDGIFDKIQSKQIVKLVWQTVEEYQESKEESEVNLHELCGLCVEAIMREAMNRRSLDNLTVVMIAFQGFQERIKQRNVKYMTTSLKSMKSERRSPMKQFDV